MAQDLRIEDYSKVTTEQERYLFPTTLRKSVATAVPEECTATLWSVIAKLKALGLLLVGNDEETIVGMRDCNPSRTTTRSILQSPRVRDCTVGQALSTHVPSLRDEGKYDSDRKKR